MKQTDLLWGRAKISLIEMYSVKYNQTTIEFKCLISYNLKMNFLINFTQFQLFALHARQIY